MRNKIKMFAQQKVTLPKGRHKIIILDEADRYVDIFLNLSYYVKCVASVLSVELLSWTVLDVPIRLSKIICWEINRYALKSVLTRLLISSKDHCFKGDTEYWGETLCNLSGYEIASSSLLSLCLGKESGLRRQFHWMKTGHSSPSAYK